MSKKATLEYPKDFYDPFLLKVEAAGVKKTKTYAYVVLPLALAYISLISLFFGGAGNLVQALLSLPFVVVSFFAVLGVSHALHIEKGSERIKDKYYPKQRYKAGSILLALLTITSLSLSSHVPYAIGGSIFLLGILGIYNLIRLSPYENYLRLNEVDDPRSLESLKEGELVDFDWDEDTSGESPNEDTQNQLKDVLSKDLTDEEIVEFLKIKRLQSD